MLSQLLISLLYSCKEWNSLYIGYICRTPRGCIKSSDHRSHAVDIPVITRGCYRNIISHCKYDLCRIIILPLIRCFMAHAWPFLLNWSIRSLICSWFSKSASFRVCIFVCAFLLAYCWPPNMPVRPTRLGLLANILFLVNKHCYTMNVSLIDDTLHIGRSPPGACGRSWPLSPSNFNQT